MEVLDEWCSTPHMPGIFKKAVSQPAKARPSQPMDCMAAKEAKWGSYRGDVVQQIRGLEEEGWVVLYTDGSTKKVLDASWIRCQQGESSLRNFSAHVPVSKWQSVSRGGTLWGAGAAEQATTGTTAGGVRFRVCVQGPPRVISAADTGGETQHWTFCPARRIHPWPVLKDSRMVPLPCTSQQATQWSRAVATVWYRPAPGAHAALRPPPSSLAAAVTNT